MKNVLGSDFNPIDKRVDLSTYLVSFSDFWFGEQSSCLGILPVFGDGILLGVNVLKDLFNRFVLLNKLDGIFWSNSPKKIPINLIQAQNLQGA